MISKITEAKILIAIWVIAIIGFGAYVFFSPTYRQETKKDLPFPIPDTVMFGGKRVPCVYTDTLQQTWGLVIGKWYSLENDDRKVLVVWYKIEAK